MGTAHIPRPHGRDTAESLREAFWILALGLMVCFAFFAALGAFNPSEAVELTIGFGVLCVLWAIHVVVVSRHRGEHDPRMMRDRERRGF
ncbi:hypothetical protein [Paraconexibacter sp.]|uniref:hypothetical protein n=1 Tax=Paraconexibacter sp. TaxID=2949640 RepID=UPI00356441D6